MNQFRFIFMGGFCFMFFLQVPVEEQGEQRMSNFDCTAMATVVRACSRVICRYCL
jgi:hypothetical protein